MTDFIEIAVEDGWRTVTTLERHGVWATHESDDHFGRSTTITHVPTGRRLLMVWSRTAAAEAMRLLDPQYTAEAEKAERPGGYIEALAWLERDGALHQRLSESTDDALDRAGIDLTWPGSR